MKSNVRVQLSRAKLHRLLKKKSPIKIGLTGGIGAGKSLALKIFQENKVPTLQTDLLSHQLLEEQRIKRRLVKAFGDGILDQNGSIHRSRLAQVAFQTAKGQKKLNGLLHPLVRREVARWIKKETDQNKVPRLVVVEVPLLFERGFYRFFDGTLSISANSSQRKKRLIKRGWSLAEIRQREKWQWTQTQKNGKADWVIYNQRDQKALKYNLYQWITQF